MGREYEPTVGQWYEDLENDETFQVLKVDEDREIVEIQHLDGDIEELDVDDWAELDLELTEEPEGWSGSKSEKDEDEEDDDEDDDWDDDEDEDDDETTSTTRTTRNATSIERPRGRPAIYAGCSQPWGSARFALLNRDELRAQRAGLLPHFAARHSMLGAAINERPDPGEHRGRTRQGRLAGLRPIPAFPAPRTLARTP